jgi:hypothetical protein
MNRSTLSNNVLRKILLDIRASGAAQRLVYPLLISVALVCSSCLTVVAQCEGFAAITGAYLKERRSAANRSSASRTKSKRRGTVRKGEDAIPNAPNFRPPGNSRLFDEFGSIKGCEMAARLDNLAVQLQNEPEAKGYIVAYSVPSPRRNYGQMLADRAKDYLVNNRGLNAARVITVNGGKREELTIQLWISSPR